MALVGRLGAADPDPSPHANSSRGPSPSRPGKWTQLAGVLTHSLTHSLTRLDSTRLDSTRLDSTHSLDSLTHSLTHSLTNRSTSVGRSGAGKSTLLAGIARLLPIGHGSLLIDGYSAESVPLRRWRQAIRAIPQDPLLLCGTVAYNLDPTGTVEEDRLWEALRLAGLHELVGQMPHALHTPLGHSIGSGQRSRSTPAGHHSHTPSQRQQLSAGHRQLLSLARLLLHRAETKLVLLDEPAAG